MEAAFDGLIPKSVIEDLPEPKKFLTAGLILVGPYRTGHFVPSVHDVTRKETL